MKQQIRLGCIGLIVASLGGGAFASSPTVTFSATIDNIDSLEEVIAQTDASSDQFLIPRGPVPLINTLTNTRIAASNSDAQAQAELADRYYEGDGVPLNMDLAVKWYQLAAVGDDAYAAYVLYTLYDSDSLGVRQDVERANAWRLLAETNTHKAIGQRQLAEHFSLPRSPLFNPLAAIMWFERAASAGDVSAQVTLGEAYLTGKLSGASVPQDEWQALRWFSEAIKQDDPLAQYRLGWILLNGKEVDHDPVEAAKWIQRAALNQLSIAQYELGTLYAQGTGLQRNPIQAYAWWTVSDVDKVNPDTSSQITTIARQMSPEDLAQAISLAKEFQASFGA